MMTVAPMMPAPFMMTAVDPSIGGRTMGAVILDRVGMPMRMRGECRSGHQGESECENKSFHQCLR